MTVYIEKPDEKFSQDSFTDPRSADICKYFSQDILAQFPVDCWVAGGSIVSKYLNQDINDIDLFFQSDNDIIVARDYLKSIGGLTVFEGEFSLKIKVKSQEFDLVKLFHNNPKDTIKCFDLYCCAVAITKEGKLYYLDGFFKDLDDKIMRLNSSCKIISDESRILQRLNKYGRKGFNLSLAEAEKFVKFLEKSRNLSEDIKKKAN
jgi:hypothetical protein